MLVQLGRPGCKLGRCLRVRGEGQERGIGRSVVLFCVARPGGEGKKDRDLGKQSVGRVLLEGSPACGLLPSRSLSIQLRMVVPQGVRSVNSLIARSRASTAERSPVPVQGGRLQLIGFGPDVRPRECLRVDIGRPLIGGMLAQVRFDQLARLARMIPACCRADRFKPLPGSRETSARASSSRA